MGAFFSKARAMEIRCRSPPDRVDPFSPTIVWYRWTLSGQFRRTLTDVQASITKKLLEVAE